MKEFFSKWYSEKYQIAITESGEFYKMDKHQFGTLMHKESHAGSLHYRVPTETKRVSRKQLLETVKLKKVQIYFLPF